MDVHERRRYRPSQNGIRNSLVDDEGLQRQWLKYPDVGSNSLCLPPTDLPIHTEMRDPIRLFQVAPEVYQTY